MLSGIPPMVNDAKQVAMDPRNQANANTWRNSNGQLLAAVAGIRQAIAPDRAPDMSSLVISGMFPRLLAFLFSFTAATLLRRSMSLLFVTVVLCAISGGRGPAVDDVSEAKSARGVRPVAHRATGSNVAEAAILADGGSVAVVADVLSVDERLRGGV